MEIKKKFYYDDIKIIIVEREESYMNSLTPVKIRRVLAPNGGIIPVSINRNQTLKSIMNDTIQILDSFSKRGADVKHELLKTLDN